LAASIESQAGKSVLAYTNIALLLIIAVAVATRIVAWWNPVAHVDDQFYLLAGQELLKGHWPYVDVWDRKPLGLFLLYAGIAWIGGGSILGLNLPLQPRWSFARSRSVSPHPPGRRLARWLISWSFLWSADKLANRRSSTIC